MLHSCTHFFTILLLACTLRRMQGCGDLEVCYSIPYTSCEVVDTAEAPPEEDTVETAAPASPAPTPAPVAAVEATSRPTANPVTGAPTATPEWIFVCGSNYGDAANNVCKNQGCASGEVRCPPNAFGGWCNWHGLWSALFVNLGSLPSGTYCCSTQ